MNSAAQHLHRTDDDDHSHADDYETAESLVLDHWKDRQPSGSEIAEPSNASGGSNSESDTAAEAGVIETNDSDVLPVPEPEAGESDRDGSHDTTPVEDGCPSCGGFGDPVAVLIDENPRLEGSEAEDFDLYCPSCSSVSDDKAELEVWNK